MELSPSLVFKSDKLKNGLLFGEAPCLQVLVIVRRAPVDDSLSIFRTSRTSVSWNYMPYAL